MIPNGRATAGRPYKILEDEFFMGVVGARGARPGMARKTKSQE
jgi:hypothetical protein